MNIINRLDGKLSKVQATPLLNETTLLPPDHFEQISYLNMACKNVHL